VNGLANDVLPGAAIGITTSGASANRDETLTDAAHPAHFRDSLPCDEQL
jgi:hypothetical protein